MSRLGTWFRNSVLTKQNAGRALAGAVVFGLGAYNENQNHTLKNVMELTDNGVSSLSTGVHAVRQDVIGHPYRDATSKPAINPANNNAGQRIQVGSFSRSENAQRHIKDIERNTELGFGLDVEPVNGKFRVVSAKPLANAQDTCKSLVALGTVNDCIIAR